MTTPICLVDECGQPCFGQDEFCPQHRGEEADECDSCGELKHTKGGETKQHGTIWAGAIDPPEYTWICEGCLAHAEDMEISRAEDRADNYGEYPQYYDGR